MKKRLFLSCLCVAVAFSSCNNEDVAMSEENPVEIVSEQENVYRISKEEAKENLLFFMEQMDKPLEGEISTRNKAVRTVKNVEVIGNNKEKIMTYASAYDNNLLSTIKAETLMYQINFEENQGFAIVSADKRSNKIYAIIDEGSFRVDQIKQTDNPGFILFMEAAIKKEVEYIAAYNNKYATTYSEGSGGPGGTVVGGNPPTGILVGKTPPRLKTRWGQREPYNLYIPNNGSTGCLEVAVAQILSYYQTINSFTYYTTNVTLNWNKIISDCQNLNPHYGGLNLNSERQSTEQVAHLLRYLALMQMDYYGASVWLCDHCGLDRLPYYNYYTANQAYTYVALGSLILMTGLGYDSSNNVVGHAWVIDGGAQYKRSATSNIYDYYSHCNWGWFGECDGYFLSEVFNLNNGAGAPNYVEEGDRPGSRPIILDNSFNTIILFRR